MRCVEVADLRVRRVMYELLGTRGAFEPDPLCSCGCSLDEHIPIRRNGGVWGTVCRGCRCNGYDAEGDIEDTDGFFHEITH
jgi:hypothetical protein